MISNYTMSNVFEVTVKSSSKLCVAAFESAVSLPVSPHYRLFGSWWHAHVKNKPIFEEHQVTGFAFHLWFVYDFENGVWFHMSPGLFLYFLFYILGGEKNNNKKKHKNVKAHLGLHGENQRFTLPLRNFSMLNKASLWVKAMTHHQGHLPFTANECGCLTKSQL